jgi:hypothetical protein
MGLFNTSVATAGAAVSVGEQYVGSQSSTALTILSGLDPLTLTQDASLVAGGAISVPGNLDLVVYADRVVIAGPISIPGGNVTIYAREIGTLQDASDRWASINVDGTAGGAPPIPATAPGQPPPAQNARIGNPYVGPTIDAGTGTTGTTGATGATGASGTAAGTITIGTARFASNANLYLSATGGAGGQGQTGQGGGEGGAGGNGAYNPYRTPLDPGPGGQGGTGGAGGTGGTGGAAGTIKVSYAVAPSSSQLTATSNGGAGGAGGAAGQPGAGGPGGTMPQIGGQAASGATGDAGQAGSTGVSPSSNAPSLATVSYDQLASCTSAAQRSMMLQRAKLSYLSADPNDTTGAAFVEAATLLAYLVNVTSAFAGTSPPSGFSTADVTTLSNVNAEASAIAGRMTQALDFYGHAANWVPMASYTVYAQSVSDMVSSMKTTESAVTSYWQNWSDQQTLVTQLQSALTSAASHLSHLQSQRTAAAAAAQTTLEAVDSADTAMNDQHAILLARIADLESTLEVIAQEQIGEQCVFDNLIKGLNLIATVSGQKAFGTAAKVAGAIQGLIPGASGGTGAATEAAVQKIDVLGTTVATLPEAVTAAYDSASGPIITEQDPNAYKLLQEQSQFDDLVASFTSVTGAAQPAIDAMNLYVTLVQQRNADVLTYNAAICELNTLDAEIAQTQALQNQASDAIAATDPQLPSMVAFISRLYEDEKWRLIRQFYLAFRALSFWALNTDYASFYSNGTFQLSSLDEISAASLGDYESAMEGAWTSALENFATPASVFPATGNPTGITVTIDNVDVIAALKQNYDVHFTIPAVTPQTTEAESNFSGFANVRLFKARPWITGATTTGGANVRVTLTHLGRETIVDTSGNAFVFTHAAIAKDFVYQPGAAPVISEEPDFGYVETGNSDPSLNATYALVGPFTTWRVTVDRSTADLSNVTSIVMEFFGSNASFPAHA